MTKALEEVNERDLESNRNMLKAILDAAVDGIITIDHRGLIQSVNRAAESLFGYSATEMLGQNVNLLMPSPYRDHHDAYLANYLHTGEAKIIGIGREVIGQRKDGSTFPMYLSVGEVQIQGQRMFTGLVHDMRPLKMAQDQLRQLNAELEERVRQRTHELQDTQQELLRRERLATLGQLAGSVAHEIRNPLGVIKNAAYFLEMQLPTTEAEVSAAHGEIRRALISAGRIISELLDYARDPKPQLTPIRPSDLFSRSLRSVEIPAQIVVESECTCGTAQACADADQIERILINLITNAIQAMPSGGTLTLRSALAKPDYVTLEVSDTGLGIALEDQARVFEPLFSRKVKGIGLGLSLSKRYAELNRGTLTFRSEPNCGAVFQLTLPQFNYQSL